MSRAACSAMAVKSRVACTYALPSSFQKDCAPMSLKRSQTASSKTSTASAAGRRSRTVTAPGLTTAQTLPHSGEQDAQREQQDAAAGSDNGHDLFGGAVEHQHRIEQERFVC